MNLLCFTMNVKRYLGGTVLSIYKPGLNAIPRIMVEIWL